MFLLKTDKNTYHRICALLPDMVPEIHMQLIDCDHALELLGFCESAPCSVRMDLTSEEMEALLDRLIQMEEDAFNDCDEPSEQSISYRTYLKYGWMYDILLHAEQTNI